MSVKWHARQAAGPSVDPHPCPPTATLCQMSQNDCYDSQGRWENSSGAGLSAQMSPAVTPGASGPFLQKQSAPVNTHSFHDDRSSPCDVQHRCWRTFTVRLDALLKSKVDVRGHKSSSASRMHEETHYIILLHLHSHIFSEDFNSLAAQKYPFLPVWRAVVSGGTAATLKLLHMIKFGHHS